MLDFEYQVLRLTSAFYKAYPQKIYKELLEKPGRQYNCLLLQSKYGYFICIPFRSNISHRWAFKFHRSKRSRASRSGLDYSKIVIVDGNDPFSFIGTQTAMVDPDEYIEMRQHISHIAADVQDYIDGYITYTQKCASGIASLSEVRKYQYSTLAYFHKELGI